MKYEWVSFESIEENKEGYFVTYNPVMRGMSLAVLTLSFYEKNDAEHIAELLEHEFDIWVNKYPTPLMAMCSTEYGDYSVDLKTVRNNEFIVGYPTSDGSVVKKWETIPDEEYKHVTMSTNELLKIYEGIPYTTNLDSEKRLQDQINQSRAIRMLVLILVCIVPVIVAFLGWANPYIGWCAFVYVLYKATNKALEVLGYLKPLEKEREKADLERLKEHHHYHCQRNPEAFNKLKLENFKADSKQRRAKKLKEIKS